MSAAGALLSLASPRVASNPWTTPAAECRGKRRRSPAMTASLRKESASRSRPRPRLTLAIPSSTTARSSTYCRLKSRVTPRLPRDERNMSLTINIAATNNVVMAPQSPPACAVRPNALPARRKRPPTPPLARAGAATKRASINSPAAPRSGNRVVSAATAFAAATFGVAGASPVTILDSAGSPTPSPRRAVRFSFGAKAHDGLCLPNRLFDDLIWSHVGISPFASACGIVRLSQSHLETEASHLEVASSSMALTQSQRIARSRATSAASTDSDSDDVQLPSLACLLRDALRLTHDLIHRIKAAAATAGSPDACVPVLPRGGGYASKLCHHHLPAVQSLTQLLHDAILAVA